MQLSQFLLFGTLPAGITSFIHILFSPKVAYSAIYKSSVPEGGEGGRAGREVVISPIDLFKRMA